MKRSFLVALREFLCSKSKKPWAAIEFNGVNDGSIAFSMSWNNSFIENLNASGFQGINQEETIQNFFLYMASMSAAQSDSVNPDEMPNLSNEANILRR